MCRPRLAGHVVAGGVLSGPGDGDEGVPNDARDADERHQQRNGRRLLHLRSRGLGAAH